MEISDTHSTYSINSILRRGCKNNMRIYIKIAQLRTVDLMHYALEIEKNAIKEKQNNEAELQKSKDRKVHYAIG